MCHGDVLFLLFVFPSIPEFPGSSTTSCIGSSQYFSSFLGLLFYSRPILCSMDRMAASKLTFLKPSLNPICFSWTAGMIILIQHCLHVHESVFSIAHLSFILSFKSISLALSTPIITTNILYPRTPAQVQGRERHPVLMIFDCHLQGIVAISQGPIRKQMVCSNWVI